MARNPITLETPSPAEAPLQDKLNEALVRELLHRTKGAGVALLAAVLLLWIFVGSPGEPSEVALFLALVGFVVARTAGAIWIERRAQHRFRHMPVFRWFAAMNLLIGGALGAIVMVTYPRQTSLAIAMCSVCIVGINSAAMVSLAGSPLAYLVYVGSNMAALTFVSFAHPFPGMEHPFQVMNIIYALALIVMMRSVHHSLRNNIVLRLRLSASFEQLRDTQAKLVIASREAGRADVATELLHSVGNVLNSVNVSATLVADLIARSNINNLPKVVAVMMEHRDDFATFFRDDPRGQKLPDYFTQLAATVVRDNSAARAELQSLTKHIDQIKEIVGSQQALVKAVDVIEQVDIQNLLDEALELHAASYNQHAIEVVRELDALPLARLDRYKALQILIVLLANARDAVLTRDDGRQIAVRARREAGGDLEIAVEDNGCGIAPDNLDRIFNLGFTTKQGGHGLGLHYSACAARVLRGRLTARSAGVGAGAEFSLVLPFDASGGAGSSLSR